MERRKHLYVNRKHFAVWLMALCMITSCISRIMLYAGNSVWSGMVLPCVAALLYSLIAVCFGKEMFYKTAIPVWLMGLCYGLEIHSTMAGQPMRFVVVCIIILLFCTGYTVITSGRIRHTWLLLPLYLLALAGIAFTGTQTGCSMIADLLIIAGMMLLLPAVKVHTDGKWHPTWGDRIDGRRVRTAPTMEQITAYFMPNRTGANNLFAESVEIEELEQYVHKKRREGIAGFGMIHVIMAAYVRTVAKYPALNRFIAGQKIFSRGEDIVLCMTVKKALTVSAPDSLVKVHLHPGDTAVDVYHKFNAEVKKAKDEMNNTSADNTVDAFMMVPSLLLKFVIWLLKTLDYFGLVPQFLLEVSPFHGSVYFTSMGSLGIKPVYHHLYDFGTVPAFCAYGRKRKAEEIVKGEVVERKYVDLKFNLDERICDGFYYASAIKYFMRVLSHPNVLDTPPETIENDIP